MQKTLLLTFLLFATNAAAQPLSNFAPKQPWRTLHANSEQRAPLYFGATPVDLASRMPSKNFPALPERLKSLAKIQTAFLKTHVTKSDFETEAWPVLNWDGEITWVFARWRRTPKSDWTWFKTGDFKKRWAQNLPQPELPLELKSWTQAGRFQIFADFLEWDSLYDKPYFGECVWTDADGKKIVSAWLSPDKRAAHRKSYGDNKSLICHAMTQPARFGGKPETFLLRVKNGELLWPDKARFTPPETADLSANHEANKIQTWPPDFTNAYASDLKIFAGETTVEILVNGVAIKTRFSRKNSADPHHQLRDVVDYLETRYRSLGLKTHRQKFSWRGIPQSNLIAVIPGSLKGAANRPVLVADHIDTAFSEDEFEKTGQRIAAPGADDNASATAALLATARLLKDARPQHDIWLTHLTGEEFPGDDLGARELMRRLLKAQKKIGGIVLLDMIAWRRKNDPVFQINAGDSAASAALAKTALDSAFAVAKGFKPVIRTRFEPQSYLYNTDGLIFSDVGYPVILFNEHINRFENLDRPDYHQSTDKTTTLDLDYAAAIVMTAIETVARLAD